MIDRGGWGAAAPTGGYSGWAGGGPSGSVFHWEGPGLGVFSHDLCAAKVRGIQQYHQTHGYIDIAYSRMCCPHGEQFEGRGLGVASAANGPAANSSKASICDLAGVGDPFTDGSRFAARQFADEVGGSRQAHRDVNSTDCPGDERADWVHTGMPIGGQPPVVPSSGGGGGGGGGDGRVLVRRGDSGMRVRDLQTWLGTLGFETGGIDGQFGPRTEAAVRAFQAAAGIDVDGIAGPVTFGRIYGGLISHGRQLPNPEQPPVQQGDLAAFAAGVRATVLRQGSRGIVVSVLQGTLQSHGYPVGGIDGVFGPRTRAGVVQFQGDRGLSVDGVVGPQTWGALLP